MYKTQIPSTDNSREMTSTFYGLNRKEVISEGELSETWNMSADHFPVLSPRDPRTLKMKAASDVWDKQTLEWKSHFEGDISDLHMIYESSFDVIDGKKVQFSFIADTDVVKNVEVNVKCVYEEETTFEDTFKGERETLYSGEFITPTKCEKCFIQIVAYPLDPETIEAEEIDQFITARYFAVFNDQVRGMLIKDGALAYLIGPVLYYNGTAYDMRTVMQENERIDEQQLISYGTQILIFPLGLYFNTLTHEFGTLWNRVEIKGASVNYYISDIEGKALEPTIGTEAPENPNNGDYWINTTEGQKGLYQWFKIKGMWQPIATTYICIKTSGNFTGFKEGDAIFMNSPLKDINEGSIIQRISTHNGDTYITVLGLMDEPIQLDTSEESPAVFLRPLPKLDYVCVSNNRVWGCYKGEENGQIINEIHACKLADPTNWYVFAGNANDSYTLSIGGDGDFTGAFSYRGYPYFFKENVVYCVYGNYPAAYSLNTLDIRGVQKGCSRSIAKVNEYLMYKSVSDVCIFDGSSPQSVSDNLALDEFSQAAAGASLDKYYISMHNDTRDEWELFCYDLSKGMWHKEDNLKIKEFAYANAGQLYGCNNLDIIGFGKAKDALAEKERPEDYVEWEAVSGEYGYEYPDRKYVSKITLRAKIPYKSDVNVFISYDDGPFELVKELRGDNTVHTQSFSVKPKRCDHYKLKLTGHGKVLVYGIVRTFEFGDDNNGYKFR